MQVYLVGRRYHSALSMTIPLQNRKSLNLNWLCMTDHAGVRETVDESIPEVCHTVSICIIGIN
ncbi:MAG: hypothetical protein VCC01_03190, partial [Candidatus Hydrogenedentota bacterium]